MSEVTAHAEPTRAVKADVLLVEDGEADALRAIYTLEQLGLTTHHITDGCEVMMHITDVDPKFVLMDLNMDTLDGLDATNLIYSAFGPKYPVIMCTSEDGAATEAYAERQGAVDYLVKPLREDELKACLDKHEIAYSSAESE